MPVSTLPLTVGGAVIGAAALVLLVVCWRRRTALGAVAGLSATGLIAFAALNAFTGRGAETAVALALILSVIGTVLLALGQVVQRLLDDEPDEEP